MGKRPTIRDVAKAAGVSTATVSYVLNDTGSVSPATADRVRRCVEQLGYRANSVAVAHRTGRSLAIGLAVPDLSNPFFTEFAQGVHRAASAEGYSVLLLDADNSAAEEMAGIERFGDGVPDGLIWVPVHDNIMPATDVSVPTVVYGHQFPGFDSLDADVANGGALQAEAVLSHGHSKVGILSGPGWSDTARLRHDRFVERLGTEAEIVWDFELDYGSPRSEEIERIILGHQEVTCVVASNDVQAIGLMRLFGSAGRIVPDEVSVVGFDDIDFASLVGPPLTTVHLGTRTLGLTAFGILRDRMREPNRPPRREIVDVSMTYRESLRAL